MKERVAQTVNPRPVLSSSGASTMLKCSQLRAERRRRQPASATRGARPGPELGDAGGDPAQQGGVHVLGWAAGHSTLHGIKEVGQKFHGPRPRRCGFGRGGRGETLHGASGDGGFASQNCTPARCNQARSGRRACSCRRPPVRPGAATPGTGSPLQQEQTDVPVWSRVSAPARVKVIKL